MTYDIFKLNDNALKAVNIYFPFLVLVLQYNSLLRNLMSKQLPCVQWFDNDCKRDGVSQ